MSKVVPFSDEPFSFTTFAKPVPTTPPMAGWDPAYMARKKEVGEKILKLKSGRQGVLVDVGTFLQSSRDEDPVLQENRPSSKATRWVTRLVEQKEAAEFGLSRVESEWGPAIFLDQEFAERELKRQEEEEKK